MAPIRSSGTLLLWSALNSCPFREPLCQAGIIGGPVAPPGVLEDVLAETGRLGELHVVTHGGQHGPGEVALQLLQDFGALPYPAVVERGDYVLLQGPVLPVVLHLLHAADKVRDPPPAITCRFSRASICTSERSASPCNSSPNPSPACTPRLLPT